MPVRIQRRRTKGYRLPPNARSVTRPSRWGNPFNLLRDYAGRFAFASEARAACLADFRRYAEERARREPGWLAPLRGKDLACYCKPGEPCHADVLIELANSTAIPSLPPPSGHSDEEEASS